MNEVNVTFEVGEEVRASRLVATHCVELLVAFREGCIPFNDVGCFFLPRMARILRDQGVDPRVIELISLGCELEDVQSLSPDKLVKNIDAILKAFLEYLSKDAECGLGNINISISK